MAEPTGAENGKDQSATPQAAAKPNDDLPTVESPSICPGKQEAEATASAESQDPVATPPATEAAAAGAAGEASKISFLSRARSALPVPALTRRTRRTMLNAAAIALAAGFGAVVGALAMHGALPASPKQEVASIEERQAMRQSITRLAKDVAALKSGVEAAGKSAQTQIAKIADRVDRAPDITGSIAKAVTAVATAPMPLPRPQVVKGWTAYESRAGVVLVEQHGGDLFQVSAGTPLPGLGVVEAIRRDGGQVQVVTPNGIIASPPRQTVRNRYRLPPYFDPY